MGPDRYSEARKRVQKKKEFFQHLTSYLVMGVFFFVLNALTAFGQWWFYWPMLGWGIGIAFHYLDVFGLPGVGNLSNEWEEKALKEEMKRLRPAPKPEDRVEDQSDREELELKDLHEEKEKRRNWNESDLV